MTNLTTQQSEAVRHLQEWKVGALFMEPGTGKTRASITLVNSSPCTGVVWIGPLRTLEAVQSEVEKWGGFKAPVTYWGVESLSASDRIFTELINTLEDCTEPFVVVDESLKIKNAEAKRTKRVLEIGRRAKWKLVLNGTPVSRNLLDMWPQMEFLSPKILNMTLAQFKRTFCTTTTITKRIGCRSWSREFVTGMENVDYLHSLIRHYVYECNLTLGITQKWHTKHYYISEANKDRYEREGGLLPCSVIDKDISNRMASTIRHNRARGSHSVELMMNIVGELKKAGMSDQWIMKEIGMDADELLRYKQLSGIAELFKDREFTQTNKIF